MLPIFHCLVQSDHTVNTVEALEFEQCFGSAAIKQIFWKETNSGAIRRWHWWDSRATSNVRSNSELSKSLPSFAKVHADQVLLDDNIWITQNFYQTANLEEA